MSTLTGADHSGARFFYLTDHFFYQASPLQRLLRYHGSHGFFASRSYHGSLMPKSGKGRPLSYPRGASTDTGSKHLSAADDPHAKRLRILAVFFVYHLCFRSLLFARRRISSASGMFMPCDPQRCRYAHRGVGPGDEADQHDQCEVSRGIAAEEVE